MAPRFEWYQLRTTDVRAAADFYADALGVEPRTAPNGITLSIRGRPVASISVIPEQARARGAPAHWLGHVGVADVGSALRRALSLGAERLGVPSTDPHPSFAVIRDPAGAIVGLSTQRAASATRDASFVRSHDHLSRDQAAAWKIYAELFGWKKTAHYEFDNAPAELGMYQRFAWDAAIPSTGAFFSAARLPHIHCQWLYYFAVPDIERAVQRVRALGGLVANGPQGTPFGVRIAQCDDAQGAAFGLWQE